MLSYKQQKGIMNAHAAKVRCRSNGDGASPFAKERTLIELTRRANTKCSLDVTHAELIESTRMSKSHSERVIKSLKKDGVIRVSYIYKYCTALKKRVVCGTRIVLIHLRQWLKGAILKACDLTTKKIAELLYTPETPQKRTSNIALFRQYTWIDTDTGEQLRISSPEMVMQP